MEHSADALLGRTAAPQHLRRRWLHGEIPDPLLVPGAEPLPLEPGRGAPTRAASAKRAAERALKATGHGAATARRHMPSSARVPSEQKRTAALVLVILVTLSIPALALALIFAG